MSKQRDGLIDLDEMQRHLARMSMGQLLGEGVGIVASYLNVVTMLAGADGSPRQYVGPGGQNLEREIAELYLRAGMWSAIALSRAAEAEAARHGS